MTEEDSDMGHPHSQVPAYIFAATQARIQAELAKDVKESRTLTASGKRVRKQVSKEVTWIKQRKAGKKNE